MSTEAKSSSGADTTTIGSHPFREKLSGSQWADVKNHPNYNNKFDEILDKTTGDVSVIMRISDDQVLLAKVLNLFKALAYNINFTLHGYNY